MALIPISESEINDDLRLLPIEEDDGKGGGGKRKITYLLECTGTKSDFPKDGGTEYLRINFATDDPITGERVELNDIMSYAKKARFKVRELMSVFQLSFPLDTEDFVGKFVFATIKHEIQKLPKRDDPEQYVEFRNNRIDSYIRLASPEEVTAYLTMKSQNSGGDGNEFKDQF